MTPPHHGFYVLGNMALDWNMYSGFLTYQEFWELSE